MPSIVFAVTDYSYVIHTPGDLPVRVRQVHEMFWTGGSR